MSLNISPRLVVGISGASGIQYGLTILRLLQATTAETHLVISKAAELTAKLELNLSAKEIGALANHVHPVGNVGATIASGSFQTEGMIIAPCSIRTMSEISTGVTSSLLSRAADVTLKERRPLVLMVRETPLHTGHLRTMTTLSEIGAVIAPPVPQVYANLTSIDDMIEQSCARTLDLFRLDRFGIELPVRRWDGGQSPKSSVTQV
ncbi:MAG: UbiX family flavin prenyltransferase [Pseudomonadota bacterium]